MIGAPGSGKGTQSEALSTSLGIQKVSTGDILRSVQNEDSPLGKAVKARLDEGLYVDDALITNIVKDWVEKNPGSFILDGFPRSTHQAVLLDSFARPTDAVFLDVPHDIVMERTVHRRSCKETGRIYHLLYDPPPEGTELVWRKDDKPELVESRLSQYRELAFPTIEYYAASGRLRPVSGVGSQQEITDRILQSL